MCLYMIVVSTEWLPMVKNNQPHSHSTTITHNHIASYHVHAIMIVYIWCWIAWVWRGAIWLASNTTASNSIEYNTRLTNIPSCCRYYGEWMMWYAHISLVAPSCSLLAHIHPASSPAHCRYTSYIIHVVFVSVFGYICCLVWWLISTIPTGVAYQLSSIVVRDSWRCRVHRWIVWRVVVAVSSRQVFISSFVAITCVVCSVLSSRSVSLPSDSPSFSSSTSPYFHATLSTSTPKCSWVSIVLGCLSVYSCTFSAFSPYQPSHHK